MVKDLQGISRRGWAKLARWTVFGTLGCMAISLAFNAVAFRGHDTDVYRLGLFSAAVIPIILAGPLFFYLTLKLRELAIANHRLGVVASTDSLTLVLNRGAFAARVDEILLPNIGSPRPSGAFLVIDADHFKTINDRYGHDQGDEALKIIAGSIRACVRSGDVVGRLGGEEFGVFLPGATAASAAVVAERIRAMVEHTVFMPDGKPCSLSVSVGGACFDEGMGFSDMFRLADERLYVAKHAGRNRVSIASIPKAELFGHSLH